jgi:hypothetical protein
LTWFMPVCCWSTSAPEQVVGEIARLVRPGGRVALIETDVALQVSRPRHRGLQLLTELLATVYREGRADPYFGRRLPHVLAGAGLVDIGVEARAQIRSPGHAHRAVTLDLVQTMRAKILGRGLIGERELDRLDRAARAHLD